MVPPCLVVLVRPKTASNVGAVARVMRNMGLDRLVLVRPEVTLTDPRAHLLATHSGDILDQAFIADDLDEVLADCGLVAATSARCGGLFRNQAVGTPEEIMPKLLDATTPIRPAALVFGPEDHGLTNAEISRCHYLIRIPTADEHPVLNLAQAVAICLYEWRRCGSQHPETLAATEPVASFADQERMFARLREALEKIHFLYGPKADALMHALRRLIGRARPTEMEVKLLLGLARQISWFHDHTRELQSTNLARREHARSIWQAAVDAARPQELIRAAFADPRLPLREELAKTRRILIVGAGKAGAAMAQATEQALSGELDRMAGLVNVPDFAGAGPLAAKPLQRIRLHAARPAGSNQPTAAGVAGARQILDLVSQADPDDVALCLLSGGGSALLPAPVDGVTLADKQQITLLLHRCGATINEMNAVRKHLSAIKGGRLAQAFTGRALFSLIISDVIGDPLDVIASGPTAPDPTTFADALAVLEKYQLFQQTPAAVREYLERGRRGEEAETPKQLPNNFHNIILGNNQKALRAAQAVAERLGYRVLNLGSYLDGETHDLAVTLAGLIRSIRHDHVPVAPPVCILSGGETTVTLPQDHGLGGRNQELVLALAHRLGPTELAGVTLLSGGTDGEDGPTDAAGAVADVETLARAAQLGLDAGTFIQRHDAYHFFEKTGDLLKTGLTQTNVMDARVLLIA